MLPFFKGKFENESFFGGGLTFYNDVAGDSKFRSGQYSLSLSYVLEVHRDEYFSAGLQGGVLTRSISYSSLYYGNQWNGLEFDTQLSNNEPSGASTSLTKADLALGIYYFNGKNDDLRFFGGVSALHLTAPKTNFYSINDKLFMKYMVHGGLAWHNGNFELLPNFMTMIQGPNNFINLGSDFKWIIREQSQITGFIDEISLSLGTYMRFGDAFYTGLRFQYAGFTVAGVYDMNVSSLSTASGGFGAYEIMLGYQAGFGTGKGRSTRFL